MTRFEKKTGRVVLSRRCTLEEIEGLFEYLSLEIKGCTSVNYKISKTGEHKNVPTQTFHTFVSIDGTIKTMDGTVLLESKLFGEENTFETIHLAIKSTTRGTIDTWKKAYENIGSLTVKYFREYKRQRLDDGT